MAKLPLVIDPVVEVTPGVGPTTKLTWLGAELSTGCDTMPVSCEPSCVYSRNVSVPVVVTISHLPSPVQLGPSIFWRYPVVSVPEPWVPSLIVKAVAVADTTLQGCCEKYCPAEVILRMLITSPAWRWLFAVKVTVLPSPLHFVIASVSAIGVT